MFSHHCLLDNFLLKIFWKTSILFVGSLLRWTSVDVCPGLKNQFERLTCVLLLPTCNEFLRFTSGAAPAELLCQHPTNPYANNITLCLVVSFDVMYLLRQKPNSRCKNYNCSEKFYPS